MSKITFSSKQVAEKDMMHPMKTEIKIFSIIRRIALVALAVVLIRELIFCILDMIIHTIFVAGILFFAYVLFHDLYRNSGTEHYKSISWISFAATIIVMVTSIFFSPGWFESYEVVNGAAGIVSVKVFQNDLYCISNGREDEIFLTWDNDVYISTTGKGEEALVRHFEKQIDKDIICEKTEYGSYQFYAVGEKEEVHASATLYQKPGYEIWKITAYHDQFKHKNIIGGVYKSVEFADWNMFDEYDDKGELIK